jgi:purine-binding chemotaxis protein CheW
MEENQQLCTFFLGDTLFGVDVREVQEVVPPQEMTRVPLAPVVFAGLLNLRGQIVMVLDLRRRLGLPVRPAAVPQMHVIVRTGDGPVSLLVDRIGDVVWPGPATFEALPATLRGSGRELLRGACKLEDQLLLLLDLGRVLDVAAGRGEGVR